jgi:hypothetical protein
MVNLRSEALQVLDNAYTFRVVVSQVRKKDVKASIRYGLSRLRE